MKKDFFTLLFIVGAVVALIIFGYTAGYQIGCALGEDLTIMTTNE